MSQASEIIFLGDSLRARFLMINNIIDRKGHAVRVAEVPVLREGRVVFLGENLETGEFGRISLNPELMVPLGTEI